MASPYSTVESDLLSDAAAIKALWLANFPAYTPERADHKLRLGYVDNPAGCGRGVLLRAPDVDAPAGVQCLHPRRFHRGDRAVAAAGLADYTVDRAHRSLGPALMLMKRSIEVGQRHYELIYGIPNKLSAAVCARAGLVKVGSLDRWVKVIRTGGYLQRWVPPPVASVAGWGVDLGLAALVAWRRRHPSQRWKGEGVSFDDARLDAIWARRPQSLLLSERSPPMLQWRYGERARGDWQVFLASTAADGPVAYLIWRAQNGCAEVGDFLALQPDQGTVPLMLSFEQHVRRAGLRSVSLEFCGRPQVQAALRSVGFRTRGQAGQVFRNKSAELQDLDPAVWYFTSFDNDAD